MSSTITVWMSEDAAQAIISAIAHTADYLDDHGRKDYEPEELQAMRAHLEDARTAMFRGVTGGDPE